MNSVVVPSTTRRKNASKRQWCLQARQASTTIAHEAKEGRDERRLKRLRKMQKYLRAVCEHNGIAITNK